MRDFFSTLLDGAAVRISMVGQDDGSETQHVLDRRTVGTINTDLTAQSDVTRAGRLVENRRLSFMGDTPVGPFEVDRNTAAALTNARNPDGRPNIDVVRPVISADDVTGRPKSLWIVDFPPGTTEREAALYEAPFEHISMHVRPKRATARSGDRTGVKWWIHQRPRPAMRKAIEELPRFLITPRVAKHRVFVWCTPPTLPDVRLFAFARDDNYFFGVLHSRIHEVWALATSSVHGDGDSGGRPVYNNTTCFETFPLPWPPGQEPASDPRAIAIAEAARRLNELREGWLNPASVDGLPLAESELKKRTLTNLYNQRPQWLVNVHRDLDEAVFRAYGWPEAAGDVSDEVILERLLAENLRRAGA